MVSGGVDVSIIVVTWNVAPFVEHAVKSCLEQTHLAVEIIVIDNNSRDGTREIVERTIAGRQNVRFVRNSQNIGLGSARNQGLDLARGDYVAFLDGDDWLEPHAMERALHTARVNEADVVVFDHSRHHQDGSVQRGHNRRHLRMGVCRTLEDRFDVVRSFSSAWNKLYLRSFILAERFRFSDTYYEDIDWSFPILMVAPRVAALPEPLVNYRLRRGSILRTPSNRHLEVFERWRSVLEFMKANAYRIDNRWQSIIATQLASQQEAMLRSRLRGSLSQRACYARHASSLMRELDAEFKLPLPPLRRLRYLLMWKGWGRLALAVTLATTLPKR